MNYDCLGKEMRRFSYIFEEAGIVNHILGEVREVFRNAASASNQDLSVSHHRPTLVLYRQLQWLIQEISRHWNNTCLQTHAQRKPLGMLQKAQTATCSRQTCCVLKKRKNRDWDQLMHPLSYIQAGKSPVVMWAKANLQNETWICIKGKWIAKPFQLQYVAIQKTEWVTLLFQKKSGSSRTLLECSVLPAQHSWVAVTRNKSPLPECGRR